MEKFPIVDLHCDVLAYLVKETNSTVYDTKDIGATVPHLEQGHVKTQVMAFFTKSEKGSTQFFQQELEAWRSFSNIPEFIVPKAKAGIDQLLRGDQVIVLPAIENASGFCEEKEDFEKGLARLEKIVEELSSLLYISFTHHTENRFGGGNYSENVGLRDDGKRLLDWMNGRRIAVDFSHSSDALVEGILDHIDQHRLDIPVMASHSNFRTLCDHVRNLPDELAQEIIQRNGLIGINFLRAYIHDSDPSQLLEQIEYGIQLGAEKHLAFGADFFHTKYFPEERHPLFFSKYETAAAYPTIISELDKRGVQESFLQQIAHKNFLDFLERNAHEKS